jgi:hypothetical protein
MAALQHEFMLLGGDDYKRTGIEHMIISVLSVLIYEMANLKDKLASSSGTENHQMFTTAYGKEAMSTAQTSECLQNSGTD